MDENYLKDQNMDLVLYFVKCAINGGIIPEEKNYDFIKNVSWEQFFKTAQMNKLIAVLYPVVKYCDEHIATVEPSVMEKWTDETRQIIIGELIKHEKIRKIVSEAEKRKLQLIFFKGIVLADLYPQFSERPGCDSDIFVYKEDAADAESFLQEMGYQKDEEDSKKQVQVYHDHRFHTIELHTCLWEDYTGKRIDILREMNLTDKKTLIHTTACGIEITTLGYEQHLIYQLFHIIKHFSLNGVGVRYLIDITLYVNRYFSQIDKNDFWEKINQLGYGKFVQYFFFICTNYLGMTREILPDETIEIGQNINGFKRDLFNVGDIYDKDAGWQIMGAMEAYFTGDQEVAGSRAKRKLNMMFPSVEAMPKVYGYVHKMPVLLPIGWIHRGIKYMVKWMMHRDSFYNASEKLDVAEHRLYMLQSLGLSEEGNNAQPKKKN